MNKANTESKRHISETAPVFITKRFSAVIVSDDAITLAMAKTAFNKDQFEVHNAADADTALKILTTLKSIDMVVLAPLKGDRTCINLVRIVREKLNNNRIPILALAGDMSLHDQMHLKQAGANAWVTKPYTLEQFDQMINFVLF